MKNLKNFVIIIAAYAIAIAGVIMFVRNENIAKREEYDRRVSERVTGYHKIAKEYTRNDLDSVIEEIRTELESTIGHEVHMTNMVSIMNGGGTEIWFVCPYDGSSFAEYVYYR